MQKALLILFWSMFGHQSLLCAQTARFDPLFSVGSGPNNTVFASAVQADGRIWLGGSFSAYQNLPSSRLVRIFPDGQKDSTAQITFGANNRINVMRLDGTGKLHIGGTFTTYNGRNAGGIERMLPNGQSDLSFNSGSGFNNEVVSLEVLLDGSILAGGFFSQFQGLPITQPAKLLADGSRDTTFNQGGSGANGIIEVMLQQNDGRILIGGSTTLYNGQAVGRLFRIFQNGQLDTSFQLGAGFNSPVITLFLQNDQRILVAGTFSSLNGQPTNRLVRLLPNGQRDASFSGQANFTSTIRQVRQLYDGRVIAFGSHAVAGQILQQFALFDSAGVLLPSGASCTEMNGGVNTAVALSDSSLLVGGNFSAAAQMPMPRLGKLKLNILAQGAGSPQLSASQNIICPNTVLFLSANGSLNGSAQWEWYTGSCGQNPFASGGPIVSVSPFTTTTYYVRGVGNCLADGPCDSITIYVDTVFPVPVLPSLPALRLACGSAPPLPQATDNCAGVVTGVADRLLPITQAGNYTLVWSYTDGVGNVTRQNQSLTVDTVDTRVVLLGQQLQALNTQGSRRWLRCDQQFAVVAGATANTFTPNTSGSYAVEIRQNGCIDTSVCVNVVASSVREWPAHWRVYPNPASGWLQAELPLGSEVELFDLQGRKVHGWEVAHESETIALPALAPGIYLLHCTEASGNHWQRIQIE